MNWSVVEVVLAVVQVCDGVDTALLASYAQLIRIPKPRAKSQKPSRCYHLVRPYRVLCPESVLCRVPRFDAG